MDSHDALRYNAHPDELMTELPRSRWRPALRQIDLEVGQWESQQTPEQREWVAGAKPRHPYGGVEAAKAIVAVTASRTAGR